MVGECVVKWILRWMFRCVVALVVLAAGVLLFKNSILRAVAEHRISSQTGLETHIDRFEVGLLSPRVTITGLRLFNPPDFGGGLFLDLPELHLEYDRAALARHRLHLTLARLHVAEINVVYDRAARSNLEAIQARLQALQKKSPSPQIEFGGIDTLNLTFDRVKRWNLQTPSQVQETHLRVQNEVFTNLKSEAEVYLAFGRLILKLGLRELNGQLRPGASVPTQGR